MLDKNKIFVNLREDSDMDTESAVLYKDHYSGNKKIKLNEDDFQTIDGNASGDQILYNKISQNKGIKRTKFTDVTSKKESKDILRKRGKKKLDGDDSILEIDEASDIKEQTIEKKNDKDILRKRDKKKLDGDDSILEIDKTRTSEEQTIEKKNDKDIVRKRDKKKLDGDDSILEIDKTRTSEEQTIEKKNDEMQSDWENENQPVEKANIDGIDNAIQANSEYSISELENYISDDQQENLDSDQDSEIDEASDIEEHTIERKNDEMQSDLENPLLEKANMDSIDDEIEADSEYSISDLEKHMSDGQQDNLGSDQDSEIDEASDIEDTYMSQDKRNEDFKVQPDAQNNEINFATDINQHSYLEEDDIENVEVESSMFADHSQDFDNLFEEGGNLGSEQEDSEKSQETSVSNKSRISVGESHEAMDIEHPEILTNKDTNMISRFAQSWGRKSDDTPDVYMFSSEGDRALNQLAQGFWNFNITDDSIQLEDSSGRNENNREYSNLNHVNADKLEKLQSSFGELGDSKNDQSIDKNFEGGSELGGEQEDSEKSQETSVSEQSRMLVDDAHEAMAIDHSEILTNKDTNIISRRAQSLGRKSDAKPDVYMFSREEDRDLKQLVQGFGNINITDDSIQLEDSRSRNENNREYSNLDYVDPHNVSDDKSINMNSRYLEEGDIENVEVESSMVADNRQVFNNFEEGGNLGSEQEDSEKSKEMSVSNKSRISTGESYEVTGIDNAVISEYRENMSRLAHSLGRKSDAKPDERILSINEANTDEKIVKSNLSDSAYSSKLNDTKSERSVKEDVLTLVDENSKIYGNLAKKSKGFPSDSSSLESKQHRGLSYQLLSKWNDSNDINEESLEELEESERSINFSQSDIRFSDDYNKNIDFKSELDDIELYFEPSKRNFDSSIGYNSYVNYGRRDQNLNHVNADKWKKLQSSFGESGDSKNDQSIDILNSKSDEFDTQKNDTMHTVARLSLHSRLFNRSPHEDKKNITSINSNFVKNNKFESIVRNQDLVSLDSSTVNDEKLPWWRRLIDKIQGLFHRIFYSKKPDQKKVSHLSKQQVQKNTPQFVPSNTGRVVRKTCSLYKE